MIQCAMRNSIAAIAGHSTVPYPKVEAGRNPRRSTALLGAIDFSLIYDAQDPALLRLRRWPAPPEPLENLPIFIEMGKSNEEDADYILFAKGTYQCWLRDREYHIRDEESPDYMLRVPMMEGWWVMCAGVGPRMDETTRAASSNAEPEEEAHAQAPDAQPQTSVVRNGMVVVAVAVAVTLLSRALLS